MEKEVKLEEEVRKVFPKEEMEPSKEEEKKVNLKKKLSQMIN